MVSQISFLGGYSLCDANGRPVRLPTRKIWALLAYLAMSRGRDIPREELAALLWLRSSDGNARASLRQEMAVLRKVIAAVGLPDTESTKELVRLVLPDDLVDARRMAALIKAATPEALRQAAACYGGQFLAGLNIAAHPFEDWLWVERLHLKTLAQDAYLDLMSHDMAGPDTEQAIATATALLRIEPTQEQGHRALMRLYRRNGRRAEALQQFQRCTEILQRELDTEPSQATIELANRIRADLDGSRRNGGVTKNGGNRVDVTVRPMRAPAREATHTLIVMVASLAGVEGLNVRLDPRQLATAQDRFTAQAALQIIKSGGQFLAHTGDTILACFGYPGLDAADLDRAIGAAQAIASKLFDVSGDTALGARIGVARGKVLIRAQADGHAEAVGIAMRQAQNLAQSGKGGDVVISDDLRSRIGIGFETDDIPVAVSRDVEAASRGYLVRSGQDPR